MQMMTIWIQVLVLQKIILGNNTVIANTRLFLRIQETSNQKGNERNY
jgi:hypothetical protein